MKSSNKTLVYDDDCPMCVWYTGAFVKTGLLEKEERKPFSDASPQLLHSINWQRSKNEIPLLDKDTNQVLYGIDALLEIIGQRFPLIKTIGKIKPVNWFLKKLYNFISYNRKVIVAKKAMPGKIDCTPEFNIFYRVLFMAVFLVFNTLMLLPVHNSILEKISFYQLSAGGLVWLHMALVMVNCLLALTLTKKEAIEYLGQVNMLALVTILLLVPLLLINKIIPAAGLVTFIYLPLLTFFIIKEYFRRMDYAGIIQQHRLITTVNLLSLITFIACLFVF